MSKAQSKRAKLLRPKAAPTTTRKEFLKGGSDLAFRQMIHDSLAFSARLEAIRDGYARLIGLTGVQYTILIAIYHLQFDRNVSVSLIAEHLHLSGAFVTNEINKLVRMGLVEKSSDPDDGRRLVLTTTREAQQRLARLAEVQAEVNDEHFSPLVNGEFDTFRRLVGELVDSTDRALALLNGLTPRVLAREENTSGALSRTSKPTRLRQAK